MERYFVITIDGPAGSGKSTVARKLAHELGCVFLDTGAIYRAVGVCALRRNTPLTDGPTVAQLAKQVALAAGDPGRSQRVLVGGAEFGEAIRTPEASLAASQVSALPEVRAALLQVQREFGRTSSLVVEGRDTGSVVFPQAFVKFYLSASEEERARRRHRELAHKGITEPFDKVLSEIHQRDRQDMTRAVAPLVCPADAVRVDTDGLTIEEVVAILKKVVHERQAQAAP